MPRRRDRQTEEFGPLTERQLEELCDPDAILSLWTFTDRKTDFSDTEQRRRAWEAHGERITEAYIEANPGRRPMGWYWYEAGWAEEESPVEMDEEGARVGGSREYLLLEEMDELTDLERRRIDAGGFSRGVTVPQIDGLSG